MGQHILVFSFLLEKSSMDGVYVIFILVEHHLSFFFYFYILEELCFMAHTFIIQILGFQELFFSSPKKKKARIEVNKIMNPAFLLGTAFNIAYWHRKYHSGTICKGVSNAQASNALSGCEREEIPK